MTRASDATGLTVLVLGGGPDRERAVSLRSASQVAGALRGAGHTVIERDVGPDDLSALDAGCDVVFPVLHGRWGEGGALQAELTRRRLAFVGAGAAAAATSMDKPKAKAVAEAAGLTTAPAQLLREGDPLTLDPPLVLKPIDEGSSFGVLICQDGAEVEAARATLAANHPVVMAERYVLGRELTVGVVLGEAMPVIEVVPRGGFYDFEAKYDRDDTQYRFDTGIDEAALSRLQREALTVHRELGVRHLSRVDFIFDTEGRAWFLEINTMPGFTDHSLLPMAAARAGWSMPELCDRLARVAHQDGASR
jgi:D-alanine-D-alanine ligase